MEYFSVVDLIDDFVVVGVLFPAFDNVVFDVVVVGINSKVLLL